MCLGLFLSVRRVPIKDVTSKCYRHPSTILCGRNDAKIVRPRRRRGAKCRLCAGETLVAGPACTPGAYRQDVLIAFNAGIFSYEERH